MILTLAALGSCGKLNTASNSLVWTMPQHLKHKAFYYRNEKTLVKSRHFITERRKHE